MTPLGMLYSEFFDLYDSHIHMYLKDEVEKAYRYLSIAKEDVGLRQLQGRIQVYNELLDLIENASAKMDLVRNESKDLSGSF